MTQTKANPVVVVPVQKGRKRDHSRDANILDATIEELGEVGYAAMTVDRVAARAHAGKSTVYRRWASKEELVLAAVARIKDNQVDLKHLPDTGNLREDLLTLFKPDSAAEDARRRKALTGLVSLLSHHAAFADAANDALVESWAEAHRQLMQRAVDRGEIPASADIETICRVLPTLAAYRALVQQKPFDRDFLVSSVDSILMPALRNDPTGRSPPV
jgi:AcrR family transcriptional regulator